MVWTERFAVGLFAFGTMVVVVNYLSDVSQATQSAERATQQRNEVIESQSACDRLKKVHGSEPTNKWSEADMDSYIVNCTPHDYAVVPIKDPPALREAGKMELAAVWFVFLGWFTLRVIDFMFGGPARRRTQSTHPNTARS